MENQKKNKKNAKIRKFFFSIFINVRFLEKLTLNLLKLTFSFSLSPRILFFIKKFAKSKKKLEGFLFNT
jgi:hypothetical protein